MNNSVKKESTKVSVTQSQSNILLSFKINQVYKTIRQIAFAYNASYRYRKGFMYLSSTKRVPDVALWCIQLNNQNIPWENTISANGSIITEKRRMDPSPASFRARVENEAKYRLGLSRLTFIKEKGGYRFAGLYRVAAFDFSKQQVVFERVCIPQLIIKKTRKTIITIEVEESLEFFE